MTPFKSSNQNIVALLGRLGNQLHQVAYGRWLEELTGHETLYDVSYLYDRSHLRYHSFTTLELPGIGEDVRQRILTRTRWWPMLDAGRLGSLGRRMRLTSGPRRLVCDYTPPGPEPPAEAPDCAWWFGFWQRAAYTETLVPEVAVALGRFGDQRPADHVIGVNVRRGDRVGHPTSTPSAWYPQALERVRAARGDAWAHAPVRVWSDDPTWCEQELDLGSPFEVVRGESALDDIAGLSRCGALVIERSTFAWWAARAAEERGATVVFPTPWWPGYEQQGVIVPSSWLPVPV
jgi:hypothetical protein